MTLKNPAMFPNLLKFGICLTLFIQATCIWEPKNFRQDPVCTTKECAKRGYEYFDNMNPSVNPCDDFYTFACGTWYTSHPPPDHMAEWSVIDEMERNLVEGLRYILETPISPHTTITSSHPSQLAQVKYFYDICRKIPSYGRYNLKELKMHVLKIGNFGKKPVWQIHQDYFKLTGESAFFDYQLFAFKPTEMIPMLLLREMRSPYGAIIHDDGWKFTEEKSYFLFLFDLMKQTRSLESDETIKKKTERVILFRHELNKISMRSRNKNISLYMHNSPREFQSWFKRFADSKEKRKNKIVQTAPWEAIIKVILVAVPKTIQDMKIVWPRRKEYFQDLANLLATATEEDLINHMELYFIERHIILTDHMIQLLEKTAVEPTTLVDIFRRDIERWELCIRQHNMWNAIGQIIQDNWFRQDLRPSVLQLIKEIKRAISSQIMNATWLDMETKKNTVQRFKNIEEWIGYPLFRGNITIEYKQSKKGPYEPNAYLEIADNALYVKSSLLKPPMYDPDMPAMYNYAALGYIIGHELYHVIQDCGKYYNDDHPVTWWSTSVRVRCKTRRTCFIEAYNKFTEREFRMRYNVPKRVDSSQTYLENYPDVMGLDAAYRLFERKKMDDPSICQVLPRFEKFSCEQMFFITFANTLCATTTVRAAFQQVTEGRHSLKSVRVNGAVANNDHFGRVFNCPTGTPMSPAAYKKCNLWK